MTPTKPPLTQFCISVFSTLLVKFEVSSANRSRDIEGSRN